MLTTRAFALKILFLFSPHKAARIRTQVGKLDTGQTYPKNVWYAPKISRRDAPGFHQKQGERPKIFFCTPLHKRN